MCAMRGVGNRRLGPIRVEESVRPRANSTQAVKPLHRAREERQEQSELAE